MKKTFYRLPMMGLAVAALMTACSQEEMAVDNTPAGEGICVASIQATAQDFVEDGASRATDVAGTDGNYTTNFETGDQIGVYVYAADQSGLIKNMPLTYDATSQTWTGSEPIYFYRGATYVAYSPYNKDLDEQTIASVDDIKKYYTETVLKDASKTYSDCDLMTASQTVGQDLPTGNSFSLTFNFSHAMSMVEFVVPVPKYKTSGGYEYYGPLFGASFKMGETDMNPLALGGGVYRSLLAPSETAVTFSGDVNVTDKRPVYFTTQQPFTPTAGTFKRVNISYNDESTNLPVDFSQVTERDLQVGDYYYADGGIVPKEAESHPTGNLAGVIFSTDVAEVDKAHGWTNAYVVSAKQVNTKWEFGTSENYYVTTDEASWAGFYTITDGYDRTQAMLANDWGNQICAALKNGTFCTLPTGTSGWFVPAPAQCISMLEGLGEYTYDATVDLNNNPDKASKKAAAVKLKTILTGVNEFIWTCVESNESNSYGFQLKTPDKVNDVLVGFNPGRAKKNSYALCPILAF